MSVAGLVPEVHDDLFCFRDIQDRVAGYTPVCQMFHLLSVVLLVTVADEAHYCSVVCKLHDVVGGEPGAVVVGQQRKQPVTDPTLL